MATAPPALSAVPEFPALSNRSTYNALAYAFGTGMRVTFAPELVALAANVYSNAVDAYDNASATGSDRLQTTADVNQAEIYKDQAASERGTAQAAAVAAAASAGTAASDAVLAQYWSDSASASAAAAAGGAYRNLLINGGFDICQRGASFSAPSGGKFVADRWVTYSTQAHTNFAQVARTSGLGGKYALSITPALPGNTLAIWQVLESPQVARIKGRTVTISLTAYCASGTNPLYLRCNKNATGDTFAGGAWSILASASGVTLTTTPTRFSFSCAIPNDGTANGVAISIEGNSMASGVVNYVYDVQLEVGSTATPFEARPIGAEEMLCKRFYKSLAANTAYACISPLAVAINATDILIDLGPADMRVTPTLSALTAANTIFYGIGVSPSSFSGVSASAGRYTMTAYSTGLTTGKASMWQQNSTPGGVAALSAEL